MLMLIFLTCLTVCLACSLLFLAGLHLYWSCGGKWGALATLPMKENGAPLFQPGAFACVVVALGLSAMAWLVLSHRGILPTLLPASLSGKLLGADAGIFTLRCLGDFRYLGFFRKINSTDFAVMDRKLYTPLCASYAISFAVLALSR